MIKTLLRTVLSIVTLTCAIQHSAAQYYSWGADRSSLKWSKLEGNRVEIIYPDTVEHTARRMMHYINTVQPDINYNFEYPALEIPFVVHPENFASNGMVMWAPLRVEFLSTPSIDGYSMPWIKQLVAHEYRHAVQYNNLDKSTIKFFNYIFGQQGAAVSLLFPPLYALEGDAVMVETQMSTYGRGLQPSFSIGYRALADELMNEKNYLKWRCGSYTSYIPDHYRMGYQIMSYAYDKYDENILDKAFGYTARNPQFISPYSIALRKFYDTSTKELLYESFQSLIDFWDSIPSVENSAEVVSHSEKQNFITYSHPQQLPDDKILSLKNDYRRPSRFVLFDASDSSEEVVAHTGSVSTRPAYAAGRVWWTEYRRSPLFAESVYSQLCYMDIEKGRPKSLKNYKNALYPTPIGQSKSHIAYVEYNPNGQYSVVELIDGQIILKTPITYPNEVHSMAWDNATERLYIIVTGDEGMWIEQQTDNGFEAITKAAYVTISNLSAHDGKLYFGSIASGKDEVHSLDLASGVERQLSESTYGSFQPSSNGTELYMTTYDKNGYHLARQSAEESVGEVHYSLTPKNLVNPERKKWDIINLDTVSFAQSAEVKSEMEYQAKKYHKAGHLFNIHSWAPIRYNPLTILNEMSYDVGLGATLVSQNLLSSCEGYLAYGWDRYQGSMLYGGATYDGLGVNLSLSATYGGTQNVYLINSLDIDLRSYRDLSFSASLPLYFYRGYHTRILNIYGGWSYSNGIVPKGLEVKTVIDLEAQEVYRTLSCSSLLEGLNKLSVGASFSNYVQSASRDLTTPFGYSASASYAIDPLNSEFSQLVAFYGKIYTPGLALNNSFTIAAAYQDAFGGFEVDGYYPLSYKSSALIPHGFSYLDISNNNYFAASAEYKFPLCYPELSLTNLLFFKRLSLGFGADYAQFTEYPGVQESIYSYGVDFIVDLNAISMSSASTLTATFSLYKPKDQNLYFQFGLGLPF
ncbi:MAG: hypothetical protein R3Y44_02260 [Rikenellaceae bacterium]